MHKPRSQQPRTSHTTHSSLPSISFPPRPSSSQSTISPPSSPTSSQPGARRPSISTTMHWLSRSPTQSSTSTSPYAASKPTRISEPKLVRGIDAVAQPRSGVLGSGATVVRTPDDALRETGVRLTYEPKPTQEVQKVKQAKPRKEKKASISKTIVSPSPDAVAYSLNSPPLPPLPVPEADEERLLTRSSSDSGSVARLRSTKTPPLVSGPVPRSPSLRSSLKIKCTPNTDEFQNVVPPLPSSVPPSPPPPFRPILVSELPEFGFDPEKTIVTLETCTTTYRTSLATINSRPSLLSRYINKLLHTHRADSTASSVYSTNSDSDDHDLAVYRRHLASQGLLPKPSHNVHIFLDRPSAPYAHILSYLRSQIPSPDIPELLPRVVQLSSSHSRLESLIELREEAAYLDLEALHKLCTDEIRVRHAPKMHARGNSGSGPSSNSIQSLHASVYTLHTLLERVETDMRSSSHGSESYRSNGKDNATEVAIPARSPPTPQSWEGPTRDRNPSPHRPCKTPPAGWI